MTYRSSKIKSARGFTLLELMVTVAILAILASLAIPSFNTFLDRHRLSGAVEGLYADLQFARSESVKRNRSVQVVFTPGATWQYVISSSVNKTCPETQVTWQLLKTVPASAATTGAARTDFAGTQMQMQIPNVATRTSYRIIFQPQSSAVLYETGNTATTCGNVPVPNNTRVLYRSGQNKEACIHINRFGRTRICSPAGANHVMGFPTCAC